MLSVVVFAATDVPSSNSTVAETMTAPSGSVTVPRKVPLSAPKVVNGASSKDKKKMLRKIERSNTCIPPRVGEARPFS